MFTRVFHYYWELIANQRRWFFAVAIIFIFGIASGVLTRGITPNLFDTFEGMFKDIMGDSFTLDIPMALKIFTNNTTASLMMIFGGMLFGIIPFLSVLFNGFIIGYIVTESFFAFPMNVFKTAYLTFATIVPHGIFEIPAVLFSATLGLRFGIEWMQKGSASKRGEIFRKNFISALLFLPLLIIILFIAAFIEIFISSKIGFMLTSMIRS